MQTMVDQARAGRLRQARERRYGSVREAAEAIGVPAGTYGGHEAGTRGMKLEMLGFYAARFGVRLEWLVFGRGAMLPSGNQAPIQTRYDKLPPGDQLEVERFIAYRESLLTKRR